jgi:hypothetical protein
MFSSDEKNGEKPKPHIDEDFLNRCSDFATKSLFSEDEDEYLQSLRALSCILQASPLVGNLIVANEKNLPRIVELAVCNPYPTNVTFLLASSRLLIVCRNLLLRYLLWPVLILP